MKRLSFFIGALLLVSSIAPLPVFAASLSSAQVGAIVGLLQAFGAPASVIANVQASLTGSVGTAATTTQPTATTTPYVPFYDSPYPKSGIGYDLSYNTSAYPVIPFSFAVVGVTGGKSFVDNSRLTSEFSWGKFASHAPPTVYINLNAPYGSLVAGHITSPKTCPVRDPNSAPVGVGTPANTPSGVTGAVEPNSCEGYNFGYNAASEAYNYATANGVTSSIWWLDVEEANSWSADTSVNDAVIQGAIDFLNTKNLRVGIYSVPYMWRNIAGTSFAPTQVLQGATTTTPTWFPIGIAGQVDASNACITARSFILGSPVWAIQYEANATAIDQNIAC